jgi:ribosomal subunit interface protein
VNCQSLPEAQRDAVEDRIRKLAEGHTDLIDVRITGHETNHHRHGGAELRITADVRGAEIVAARTRDDLGLALDESMDAFDREIRKLRDRRRDKRTERPALPPEQGVVDRVVPEADHGFILTDSGERVYFHRNSVKHGLVFEELEEGARVALNLEGGEEGLQATVVFPAPPAGTRP